jgi:hypothetical protein
MGIKNHSLTYWRVVAVVAAIAWMLVLVYTLYMISSAYEKIARGLHPYFVVGLQGASIIACGVLVIFPLQFSIYAVFCSLWGIINIIDGGSYGGILMYGLSLLFSLKAGFFQTHRPVKLSFAVLLLAGAILSQIRYGSEHLIETLLNTLAVSLMAMLGVLLYSKEIQKQVSGKAVHEDATADVRDMVTSNEQEKTLLLHKATFSQRDAKMLQSILAGEKYESIATQHGISLSSVKKRVKVLYEHLNQPDRESFTSIYADYSIELAVPSSKSELASNTSPLPMPQNEAPSNISTLPSLQSSGES